MNRCFSMVFFCIIVSCCKWWCFGSAEGEMPKNYIENDLKHMSTLIDWLIWILPTFFFSYFYIKWHETLQQSFGTWRNTKHTNFFSCPSSFVPNTTQQQLGGSFQGKFNKETNCLYLQGIFFVENLWFPFLVELHWNKFRWNNVSICR